MYLTGYLINIYDVFVFNIKEQKNFYALLKQMFYPQNNANLPVVGHVNAAI